MLHLVLSTVRKTYVPYGSSGILLDLAHLCVWNEGNVVEETGRGPFGKTKHPSFFCGTAFFRVALEWEYSTFASIVPSRLAPTPSQEITW